MIEILIASCITVNGIRYCPEPQSSTPVVPQGNEIIEQENVIQEEVMEVNVPIHQLKTQTMTDPKYGRIVFTYTTPKAQNDCAESMLFVLEGREQRGDSTCADMVTAVFGQDFTANSVIAENVFRMQANYTYSYLKRHYVLPLGLERRLTTVTGLSLVD